MMLMTDERPSESRLEAHGETPTIEVRVYLDGRLLERDLCESEIEAALAVEAWTEIDGIECEVDDLSIAHRPDEILEEPEPVRLAEDHPTEGR
jgi:hypothetical protein